MDTPTPTFRAPVTTSPTIQAPSATPTLTSTPQPPTPTQTQPPPEATFTDTPEGLPPARPIPHFPSGQAIDVTTIQMVDIFKGWAIGGLDGMSDHVLRTEDGGSTWQDVTPPEPARVDTEPEKIATGYFMDELRAWVTYFPYDLQAPPFGLTPITVWRTPDGGQSWEPSQTIDVEFLGTSNSVPYLHFSDPLHGWILARLDPVGMHRYPIYLLRTTDGGDTWEQIIDPYSGRYLQSCHKTGMAFADSLNGWVSYDSCPRDGVYIDVTADGGKTWELTYLPLPTSDPKLADGASCSSYYPDMFSPTAGNLTAICLIFEDTIEYIDLFYSTEDGGTTWRSAPYPGGTPFFLTPQVGWALGRDIYQTSDGGATWTQVKSVNWDGQFSFVSQTDGWAVARDDEQIALVQTRDGGRTWAILETRIGP